ncbi:MULTISPECIES: DUF397 domain-containing protein [unclassified Streptomyces]|uniref:DUF397 domain-containing protein n=1 Tax=unclassified Streptomyces TaxID=2593676 RepID=UPI00341C8C49
MARILPARWRRHPDWYRDDAQLEEHPSAEGSFTLLTTKGGHQLGYAEIQGHPCLISHAKEVRQRAVHIRDSKNPHDPQPAVTPEAWAAFTSYATQ